MAAEKVLIQGASGRGKTFSIMHMNPETTCIVSPEKTRLPFRNQFEMLVGEVDCGNINDWIDGQVKKGKKAIIIDDFQYILAIPYMHRIKESGWDKYNDFGANYFEILDHAKELPDDVILYFMTHTETLEDGTETVKLIGKLLREKITIEGLFTIVLKAITSDGKYYFTTQNNGKDTVKSPFGMFDTYAIENNLKYVDDKIRNYYFMDGAKSDEEMKKDDEQVAAPEVEKPEPRRRGRSKTSDDESGRSSRRSRRQESAKEDMEKMMNIVDEVAGDREEVPMEEVIDAIDKAKAEEPQTDMGGEPEVIDTPPRRRTRRVRN